MLVTVTEPAFPGYVPNNNNNSRYNKNRACHHHHPCHSSYSDYSIVAIRYLIVLISERMKERKRQTEMSVEGRKDVCEYILREKRE